MKKMCLIIICIMFIFSGCGQREDTNVNIETTENTVLKTGDTFSVTGVVDYSDEPSDIGREYCFITGDKKLEYTYVDVYDKESKWTSEVFYTKGQDTELLKKYVGERITVSGTFDAECHGIPYITDITVLFK